MSAVDPEIVKLKTQVATLSMTLAGAQANSAQLKNRAQSAEEMLALLQTQATVEQIAGLVFKHMDQNQNTMAHHQLNLIQTTAVSLTTALTGNDTELREVVNVIVRGLKRAIDTMLQIRVAEDAEHVELRKQHNQSTNQEV